MLSDAALSVARTRQSTSFAIDLAKWLSIMEAYTGGGHAYHATLPTDALRVFRDAMLESKDYGFAKLKDAQWDQGNRVRALLASRGFKSVAAEGFGAPGVVVCYTNDPDVQNGKKFSALGLQIAAGVPLQCDEGDAFRTFRLGLFGLDKLYDVDASVSRLEVALDQVV
jgi:aspartate aminotransferase-like enzyme